ncbi:MAG: cytosine deaminase, partial [Clostridiaceae bacterium]|nr:cytosine deaminase [Clostridiaceae bacterium]
MSLLLQNARLRHRDGLWDIDCQGKSIARIGQQLPVEADQVIDLEGKLLVPALIDP